MTRAQMPLPPAMTLPGAPQAPNGVNPGLMAGAHAFLISTCGGTIIAIIVTIPMKKAGILDGEIQRREKL